jgi:hypothetical protein
VRVEFHPDFAVEFLDLRPAVQDELMAHVAVLAQQGPGLGRPRVDTLKGSRIANLKEMRFSADGGVWRVAFAFDGRRVAMLLVAGDKCGVAQDRFYRRLIVLAERRFASWAERG